MVPRCSGSCHAPSHTCLPTRITNTTVKVMAIQTTYSTGIWNTLCTEIPVETHLSCACACRVSPGHCDAARQFYDGPACQCRCKDQVARLDCLAAGKIWNEDTCACVCPQRTWRACSTGFTFDYAQRCDCVRTVGFAQGGLTIAVAAFAVICLALSAAVFHFKRRRAADDRRQRLTDILTEEASATSVSSDVGGGDRPTDGGSSVR